MAISTTFTLKFAGAAVERGLARVQSAFKSLGGVAMRIGKSLVSPFAGIAAAAGGLLAAGTLLRTAVELNAIGEAGRAGDRALANVTKQMGLFGSEADDVTKRLIDYADATSRMTGVDGESIGVAQTKLMTFKELAKSANVAGGAFDRATMAAIDMASAGFGSAETNAVQLGKALNDPIKGINSLTRSGITFTAQEKAKIKTLVESNQMLKAQGIILKSIETQVGGTAEASATSSGKITASWQQIKDAFAEPFSMGIDSIPGALESAFPKIIAKAEELGKLIGTSISDAVNGDTQRLILVGSLIGDLIKEGLKLSLRGMTDIAGQFYLEKLESQKYNPISEISRNLGLAEKHKLGAEYQGKKAIRESIESISKKYAEALAFIPQKQGPHPTMRGISYAPASHPSRMVDEKGHRIMFDIKTGIDALNQKLAPQP
jgi:hypothetical protein